MSCSGFLDLSREIKWHMSPTASYGVLGWFQSLLRMFAIAVALLSWIQFIVDGERSKAELRQLTPQRWTQIVVTSLIILYHVWKGLLIVVTAEAFAAGLHVLMFFGDIMILLDLIFQFDPSAFVFLYAMCNVLAEILQIIFLFMRSKEHLTKHYHLNTSTLFASALIGEFLYLVLLVAQVVIYTTTYQKFHGY